MEEKKSSPQAKIPESEEEQEKVIKLLEERLEKHDEDRKAAQDKLHDICEELRTQIDELEERINKELEEKFTSEDNRLQATLSRLRGNSTTSALQKAKAELLVGQSYEVIDNKEVNNDLTTLYKLKSERQIIPELMGMRKTTNVRVADVNKGSISVEFTCLNPDEERVLSDHTIVNPVKYKCLLFKKGNEQEGKEYPLHKNEGNDSSFTFTPDILGAETTYRIRVKMVVGDREYEWSDEVAEFTTPEFRKCCVWKECPGDVDDDRKYSVDEENPRIASKINSSTGLCTIIGCTHIPHNTISLWSIKILKSKDNNEGRIWVGIAPNDINQNDDHIYIRSGWYLACWYSVLFSGPPHNYGGKEYGPRKGEDYVHAGDSVGVVVDTTRGDLSFVLNGMNLGVAYRGIPLDKPLVPCVLLEREGDSVELDLSEVKENVDSFIPVPSSIIVAKSITWDTITLAWDEVSDASFYQIEVDGSKFLDATTTNTFTKRGLLPETEHSFRVRTVRGSSVSEWSSVVKGRTLKAPEFSGCVWKECPGDVDGERRYSVDERNPRVATKVIRGGCTIIGNTYIPLNKVTSWNIKVHKSMDDNGRGIWIGIAPFDINQNDITSDYGWYFNCHVSKLCSGPPHYYNGKHYGPRKGDGQYVHTGDSVGVVVNTTRGDLSFVIDGVNYGVAYAGIPLDKPLVPCVSLIYPGDSVELVI